MNIIDLLNTPTPPREGETKLVNGQLAMCIREMANYGGGSGPLWAIENMPAQFTLTSHGTYVEGVCRKLDPKEKLVTMEMTKGLTWGKLVSGTRVVIPIHKFKRYHAPCDAGDRLILESVTVQSRLLAEQAFEDISRREIEEALKSQYQNELSAMLDVPIHSNLKLAVQAYLGLCHELEKSRGQCAKSPSRKAKRHIKQIRRLISPIQADQEEQHE